MTRPSRMSSEYSIAQPASCAAAMIVPSYTLNWYRSARAKPRSCVSNVRGTIFKVARKTSRKSRVSTQLSRTLRMATLANSFKTWTLMVPPAARRSSVCSAFPDSVSVRYTSTLESKKTPSTLIGFEPVELEVLGQSSAVLAKPREKRSPIGRLPDLDHLRAQRMNLDVVAFLQAERLHDGGRQAYREAVAPFCDLHSSLLDIHNEDVYPCERNVKIRQFEPTLQ